MESEAPSATEGFEVAFLPWLGWEREITVGPASFSPFRLDSLRDPAVREYLSRYFPRYAEADGKPVRVIVLATHSAATAFRHHEEKERAALSRAAAALALSSITDSWVTRVVHHNEIPVPSADSFQLLFQRFTGNSQFVAVTAGRAHHTWPLEQVIFTRPWAASDVFGGPDRNALEALATVLLKPDSVGADFVERVWRSLEWFRLAHLDGAEQTDEAKLVGMATAFESLFGQMESKRREFAENVECLVRDPDMGRGVRLGRRGNSLNFSLSGCWAWDFYEIRSRLVHGERVPADAFNGASGMPHVVIADLVFRECLLRELFSLGCFGVDLRDAAARLDRVLAAIPEGPEPFDALEWVVNDRLQFRRVHQELGWSRPKAIPVATRADEVMDSGGQTPI